ncbi:hypothetical protein [Stutzerimonas xanthomarina]|uniref:hypothetical protein n=1 Tax=Stutzerimonas xanthomarina TaxID=271420 RepID=UPI003AA8FD09
MGVTDLFGEHFSMVSDAHRAVANIPIHAPYRIGSDQYGLANLLGSLVTVSLVSFASNMAIVESADYVA